MHAMSMQVDTYADALWDERERVEAGAAPISPYAA